MTAKTTRALENEWLEARRFENRNPTSVEAIKWQAEAWSAYVQACHEINECLTPRCTGKVEDGRGYCPIHREAWRQHHARMKRMTTQ